MDSIKIFFDEHMCFLNEMKSNVKILYNLHQRELGTKTRSDWLENMKYNNHYHVDLNWCFFFHHSRCVSEEVGMK